MAVARRQVETLDAGDWIAVADAAQLTSESGRTWRRRAETEATLAAREYRQPLAQLCGSSTGKGRSSWWVHRSIDRRLTRCPTKPRREQRASDALLARFPRHVVELAYAKARWLSEWRKRCQRRGDRTERELAEGIVREATQAEGGGFSISFRSLQAWRRAYGRLGPDRQIVGVEGLIDRRACATDFGDGDDGTPCLPSGRDPRAVEFFYSVYHCENKLSAKRCHEVTRREARRERWAWPASYSATRKWLHAHDNRSLSCLLREGRDVWCRRYMPYLEIDYRRTEPGECFQTDHHQCDFWIEHDGKQIRPWLTAVQDMRSRCVVGWHLGASPHSDAIVAAYLMAFKDWALPQRLRIDNGKDFASEWLTGATKAERDRLRRVHGPDWQSVLRRDENLVECGDSRFMGITAELGIQTVFAIPYAPYSKGQTERVFRTFEERCGKTFATYCGNSTLKRPECLEDIRNGYTRRQKKDLRKKYGKAWKKVAVLRFTDKSDVPTMEEARERIAEYIDEYHDTAHGADDMSGRTPLEVWSTAQSLRRASDLELLFLMQTRGVYKVGANGVSLKVSGETIRYGRGNACLYPWKGRDVLVAVDPNDLASAYAFTADRTARRFIGRLDANASISPNATAEELREAHAEVGRERKIMHQAGYGSAGRTRTAMAALKANRREKRKLKATGTEGDGPRVVPVATGFEGCAEAAQTVQVAKRTDKQARDLAIAAEALGFGKGYVPVRDRRQEEGTEAAPTSSELLQLVGGRHGRSELSDV